MKNKRIMLSLLLSIIILMSPLSLANAEGDFDFDQAIIYFMLTDRFNNGDETNDDPNGEDYDKSHLETYHGGDFRGLIEKLDYLKDLGVNTIWITPIADNIDFNNRSGKDYQYGYHGYWAKDFTNIDEHLGDIDTFKELIDEIHARDMKLMVDVVINHTGYGMKMTDQANGISNFPTKEEQEVFDGMLRADPNPNSQVTGELAGLPDFITEDPEVLNKVIVWQKDWIEKTTTEKGNSIDYFRVDTVKHVELNELREFVDQVKADHPNFKMIGEYFDGSIFYNGNVMDQGGMDSVLDFDFKSIARKYTRGNFEEAEKSLIARNNALTEEKTAGQFLSSHDEHGFLAMKLNGDEGLFKIAASLQLTAKGQPVIYYGEEIGQSGKNAGDMDKGEFSENRYDFDWEKVENNNMIDHYKKLLKVRNDNTDIFSRGQRKSILADKENGISIFERELDGKKIYVALNIREQSVSINIGGLESQQVNDLYSGKEITIAADKASIEIPSKDQGGTFIFESDKDLTFSVNTETPNSEENNLDESTPDKNAEKKPNKLLSFIGVALLITLGFLFVAYGEYRREKKKQDSLDKYK